MAYRCDNCGAPGQSFTCSYCCVVVEHREPNDRGRAVTFDIRPGALIGDDELQARVTAAFEAQLARALAGHRARRHRWV